MAGVSDLTVIEGSDPHEHAASQRHVKLALGIETARDLERPMPGRPAPRAATSARSPEKSPAMMTPGTMVPTGMSRSSSTAYGTDSASVMNQRAPSLSPTFGSSVSCPIAAVVAATSRGSRRGVTIRLSPATSGVMSKLLL